VFKFITHRPFWLNLLLALLIAVLLVFSILKGLGMITKHGQYLTVPEIRGKNTVEAIRLLESKGFDVRIQDSIYTDTLKNGIVIKQLPDGNSVVKVNRTVFLTVNRVIPPMITMPKLKDLSLSFALDVLERNHLKLEDTIYKPDFMKGAVIAQQYNGQDIEAGAKVQWGSKILLVIGGGKGDETILVPFLVGMRYAEAKALLDTLGILPIPVPENTVKDTMNAFVWKQTPMPYTEDHLPNYLQAGQVMDVFLSPNNVLPKDSLDVIKPKGKKLIKRNPHTP
jgi:eukaryotic-like serine/threonine-protein kinase